MDTRTKWSGALVVIAAALLSTPAEARQSPEGQGAPAFFIEEISVENTKKFQAGLIVSESLLEEGREYTEAELRDAIHRIVRVPLILEADFSLEKGSERGRFILVISVTEARRWFFGVEAVTTFRDRPISVNGLETTDTTVGELSLVGYRVPVAGYGVFFVTGGGTDGSFQLGYTHNNLFGRNILLSLKAAIGDCSDVRRDAEPEDLGEDGCATEVFDLGLDPTLSSWTIAGEHARFRLNLGIPIRGNHSLRLTSSLRAVDDGFRRAAFDPSPASAAFVENRDDVEVGLSWVYNSLDDSILPSAGRFVEGGLNVRNFEADLRSLKDLYSVPFDSTEVSATSSFMQHWPLTDRDSVRVTLRALVGRGDVDNLPLRSGDVVSGDFDTFAAEVRFGHSRFLHRVINGAPKHPERKPRWRELRWENEIELFYDETSPDFDQPFNAVHGFRVGTGLTYRTTWGVFKIRLAYEEDEG